MIIFGFDERKKKIVTGVENDNNVDEKNFLAVELEKYILPLHMQYVPPFWHIKQYLWNYLFIEENIVPEIEQKKLFVKLTDKFLDAKADEIEYQCLCTNRASAICGKDYGIKSAKKYQTVPIDFFKENQGNMYLADDMGTGKTFQILACTKYWKLFPILWVCPKNTKINTRLEAEKWFNLTTQVIKKGSEEIDSFKDITIISYGMLDSDGMVEKLLSRNFKVLVCDEAHYIKSSSADRTINVFEISKRIPCCILASGTPIANGNPDLYSAIKILKKDHLLGFQNKYEYERLYCGGCRTAYGWTATESTHTDKLALVCNRFMLRRTKDKILPELPEKLSKVISIENSLKEEYDKAINEFRDYVKERTISKLLEIGIDFAKAESEAIHKAIRACFNEILVKSNYLRQIVSEAKIEEGRSIISKHLETGEKMVYFVYYKETQKSLKDYYGDKCLYIYGENSDTQRAEAIKQFQEGPIPCIICALQCANMGVTLTAANKVFFHDLSWSFIDTIQAIDRIHRIGQNRTVYINFLIIEDSIDESIYNVLSSKGNVFSGLLNSNDAIVNRLGKMLEEKK